MVEWKKLGDLCEIGTGSNNREDACENGFFPFFVRSKDVLRINTYLFDEEAILIPGEGGIGEIFHYIKGKYGLHQRTYRVHTQTSIAQGRFIYYYLFEHFGQYINKKSYKSTATSIRKPMLIDFPIAIPSLSEQNRIVGILDTFTDSIENLKQQIAQRRKQYEFYRDQLLDFSEREDVGFKTLKEIVKSYCTGATPNKGHLEYYEGGTIPWLRTQDVKFNEIYEINSFVTDIAVKETGVKWIPANCVIVAISGATAGRCAINKIPTTTNQHCLNLEIDLEKALFKYVYYCVYNAYAEMISKKQGARGDLNSSIILGIKIPIPLLEEQQRIVSILDTFEASISNLEAQLAQRQKQYEYYRNKLLTFE